MRKHKIFISCPITKYIINGCKIDSDYKEFIQKLYSFCAIDNKYVYLALERDSYDISKMKSDDLCTLQDYSEMKDTDIVIAIPENSQGVAVEVGWASSLNKKIILILDHEYNYSPLIKAIGVIAESNIIYINRRGTYLNSDNSFFEEITSTISKLLNNVIE